MDTAAEAMRALVAIAKARKKLESLGIVRSQRIVADFGEWLASQVLSVPMASNRVQRGWDLDDGSRRIQVKTHARAESNRARRTVIQAKKMSFSELAILRLDPAYHLLDFYLISREDIKRRFPLTAAKYTVYWSQLPDCSVRRIPRELAGVLSKQSALVAG